MYGGSIRAVYQTLIFYCHFLNFYISICFTIWLVHTIQAVCALLSGDVMGEGKWTVGTKYFEVAHMPADDLLTIESNSYGKFK